MLFILVFREPKVYLNFKFNWKYILDWKVTLKSQKEYLTFIF